ncbi:MAG: hypothetical protein OHK0039_11790 [Bacteroidia bacterium]
MATTHVAFSQGFVADFESGSIDTTAFTIINADSLIPALPKDSAWAADAWIAQTSSTFDGYAALSISWYADANGNDVGPADDWLVLPQLTIDSAAVLRFDAKSATSSGNFPDDYWVLITTGEPTVEGFQNDGTILLQVDDEASASFTAHEIDLAAYAGQAVYIAFRNVTNIDGYGLWIDNIFVGDPNATAIRVDAPYFDLSLAPNPGTGHSRLHYTLAEVAEVHVQVRDLTGRVVADRRAGRQPQGVHSLDLTSEGLTPGVYLVTIAAADRTATLHWSVLH